MEQNQDDIGCEASGLFAAKNNGKIFRLSAILSYLFKHLDPKETQDYENKRANELGCVAVPLVENVINAMGMDAAIDLIKLSHSQIMSIIGFDQGDVEDTVVPSLTDIGKLLKFGGSILYLTRMTYEKALGRKSNKKNILDTMYKMQSLGLGNVQIESKKKFKETTFRINERIVESAREDPQLRAILYSNGVTLSSLESCIASPDKKWSYPSTSSQSTVSINDKPDKENQQDTSILDKIEISSSKTPTNPLKRLMNGLQHNIKHSTPVKKVKNDDDFNSSLDDFVLCRALEQTGQFGDGTTISLIESDK